MKKKSYDPKIKTWNKVKTRMELSGLTKVGLAQLLGSNLSFKYTDC